jgi:hypothetical protein
LLKRNNSWKIIKLRYIINKWAHRCLIIANFFSFLIFRWFKLCHRIWIIEVNCYHLQVIEFISFSWWRISSRRLCFTRIFFSYFLLIYRN